MYFIYKNIESKYKNFVLQNSIYLRKLQEINSKYKFYEYVNFDQKHIYDNEKMFCDISCLDYLVYQLQFISSKVINQVNRVRTNKKIYIQYIDEIKTITERGDFITETGKLKIDKLITIEEKLIKQYTYSQPYTEFNIEVTLYCSQINGRAYARKTERYFADEILNLIKRLNNRNGHFYNDRQIWDSICRVERGRVSNKMRFSIYERDGYRCRKCGVSQRYAQLEIDHIIPISKGGKSTCNNLQTLCHRCNVEKGDRYDY